MAVYNADFPAGTRVRITGQRELEDFIRAWKYHHPIRPEQLAFAEIQADLTKL
jgi:hypothetical protein